MAGRAKQGTERRLLIQERRPRNTSVPVDISHADRTPAPRPINCAAFPLCVTFEYRGHRVICRPFYDDAGVLRNFVFDCPRCGQTRLFAVGVYVFPSQGRICCDDMVSCSRPGCDFRVEIAAGQAVDVRTWR